MPGCVKIRREHLGGSHNILAFRTQRAGLTYGRDRGGVTFHTLRHIAQTEMADLGITEATRSAVMGHTDTATTRKYTHRRPVHLVEPIEQLSTRIQIADVVMRPVKHLARRTAKISTSQPATEKQR